MKSLIVLFYSVLDEMCMLTLNIHVRLISHCNMQYVSSYEILQFSCTTKCSAMDVKI